MPLRIIVEKAGESGIVAEMPLETPVITIGRLPGSGLHLPEARISGTHARIEKRGEAYALRDLGSVNGTVLNGSPVARNQSVPLKEGDLISIGTYVIRVVLPAGQTAAEPPEPTEAELPKLRETALRSMEEISKEFVGGDGFRTPEDVSRFAAYVRMTLKSALDAVVRSLKARKEFEQQFSAELTQIRASSANPLKRAAGGNDAARFLLDWRTQIGSDARQEALEGAFRDLMLHQLGLVAGVQEALKAVLVKLDPKGIEADVRGLFRSGKAWKRFVALHRELFEENAKLFNEIIAPGIREGYLLSHKKKNEQEREPA